MILAVWTLNIADILLLMTYFCEFPLYFFTTKHMEFHLPIWLYFIYEFEVLNIYNAFQII